jgi:acyl-CoA reductase-like NAD-dependent aldehyde dehydrogenase
MASPAFPEPPPAVPATTFAEAEALLNSLDSKRETWVKTSIEERVRLLKACIATTAAAGEGWVKDAAKGRGLVGELEGEEWIAGVMVTIRNLRLLAESLEAGGQKSLPKTWERKDGWKVAKVFPAGLTENLMYTGWSGEIWVAPEDSITQGHIYREKTAGRYGKGGISLVLAAGNVASIGPTDALYKLFVEDEVVLLKTNPVNSYLAPHWEAALKPLVDAGFLAIVNGGAEIGGFLCHHSKVSSIHITGSDKTHDAIVWGAPSEQARRKAENQPVLNKPISSELGCVTPVLVTPGDWSESDLDFQAAHIAGMVGNNGSFNCNAAKVVVTASGWKQREAFLSKLRAELKKMPPRRAYYPGAEARYKGFIEHYPQAEVLGETGPEVVPWTLLPNVPPQKGAYALTNEAFCGVLAETTLDAKDAPEFLEKAVGFANEEVWGTLSCVILVHPGTEKKYPEAVDKAVAGLKFGGIGYNVWPGVIFGAVSLPWGAYPGHTLDDIRSGIGSVHNSFLVDKPHHAVLRAPFRIMPKPLWAAGHKNLLKLAKALVAFEQTGSIWGLFSVLPNAFRG